MLPPPKLGSTQIPLTESSEPPHLKTDDHNYDACCVDHGSQLDFNRRFHPHILHFSVLRYRACEIMGFCAEKDIV